MVADEAQLSVAQRAADLQARHRTNVAANLVTPDSRWEKPCRAYNVHILLSPRVREALGRVQEQLASIEPGLLICPPHALHVSVAWLLAVHAEYEGPKDELWARYGECWIDELTTISADTPPFRLRYERVVATDSAIVALASPVHQINGIRRQIRERVTLPPQTRNTADVVHTTLCRYRDRLTDPARLLAAVERTRMDLPMEIYELNVSQERVYPSLDSSVLARLPLQNRAATAP